MRKWATLARLHGNLCRGSRGRVFLCRGRSNGSGAASNGSSEGKRCAGEASRGAGGGTGYSGVDTNYAGDASGCAGGCSWCAGDTSNWFYPRKCRIIGHLCPVLGHRHIQTPGRARLLPSPNFSEDHGSAGASPYRIGMERATLRRWGGGSRRETIFRQNAEWSDFGNGFAKHHLPVV